MDQPNIRAYLSKNEDNFMEMGIGEQLESLFLRCGLTKAGDSTGLKRFCWLFCWDIPRQECHAVRHSPGAKK